jgi:hypothetical protein
MGKRLEDQESEQGATKHADKKRPAENAAARDRSPRARLATRVRRTLRTGSQPADAASKPRAASSRHSRLCNVCKHPDRDAIELEFLRWRCPDDIANDHGIADRSSIYRHAHATGIFRRRRQTIRLALEPLLEQACTVNVNASAIISAVRLYAQMSDTGGLVPRTKTVIIHHVTDPVREPIANPAAPATAPNSANPNRNKVKLDHAPTS